MCLSFSGPLEFVEPDLSSLPPPRPMSPDIAPNEKRDSMSEKSKTGIFMKDLGVHHQTKL